ncbi:MAG: response regulator [Acidobacteria bacterium]|nr:response regulator [Acidobacteriota bacterium]
MNTHSNAQGVAAKKILCIDPHIVCREMLRQLLGEAGYAVSTASSIADGLDFVKREIFDLIILETEYTNGSSAELYEWIRNQSSDIPIIFFSSAGYDPNFSLLVPAGAQKYLTKPDGIFIIERTIAELLTARQQHWNLATSR